MLTVAKPPVLRVMRADTSRLTSSWSVPDLQAVVLPQTKGYAVLERMLAAGAPVGPVIGCRAHEWLRIPVERRAVGCLMAARVLLSDDLVCVNSTMSAAGACPWREWLLPSHRYVAPTDFTLLFDFIQRVRRTGNGAHRKPLLPFSV